MNDPLGVSARYIKGVGPKKFQLINKLGIKTIKDLLFYFPRRHEDRSKFLSISEIKSSLNQFHTIKGTIQSSSIFRTKNKLTIFQMAVTDGTGIVYATWFNQPYMKKYFKIGDNIILYGKVQRYQRLQINVPEYELITDDDDEPIHTGRIVPIYPLVENVRQRMLRSIINLGVNEFARRLPDPMAGSVKANQRLVDLKTAISQIHFPEDFDALQKARRRLVFDEFFYLQSALALKRARIKLKTNGISHKVEGELLNRFTTALPFELTAAQKKVISHIMKDMASPRPMCRLLQGDVGSGKTIVALHAVIAARQGGYQSAMMSPTEILAQQHYSYIKRFLLPLGVKVGLLTSGLAPAEKNKIKAAVKSGELDVIVGTHSLIEEDVRFNRLGLVIVDEQHKFGVAQRLVLAKKGLNPDVLVMTATPIPRTLALTIYGDMDISVIDQMPVGRIPVKTYLYSETEREKVYAFMRQEVKKGRQAFVVYPLIDESTQSVEFVKDEPAANGQITLKISRSRLFNLKAATKMYEDFKNNVFSDLKVGLVHGRLPSDEKNKILNDFRSGAIDILVSTIVVEVGIDMPNASVMVVEHAERFGLSQLHQLRGRIGRSSNQSYCILLADAKTESAKQRMDVMLQTSDGFKIAERDLAIRGPGDFMGTRQHGLPEFRLANIMTDSTILEAAKQEAFNLVKADPDLSRYDHRGLRLELAQRFKGSWGQVEPDNIFS
jgi:ATP-dependent DNA helicase RecG